MYHYTDGGLTNVWLVNGYQEKKTPYGKAVAITDVEGLTKAICSALVCKKGRLTGNEFRYIRQALRLSQSSLAKMLDNTEQAVALWEKKARVPAWADKLVRFYYVAHTNGNTKVKAMVKVFNQVEALANQKIVLSETDHGWEAETESEDSEVSCA